MSADWIEFQCKTCKTWRLHGKPGRVPDYCSNACRQRAFYHRYKKRTGLRYAAR